MSPTLPPCGLSASLPPSSLLPLLTSLINEKPELKPIVLSLIPRPTLETAVQAINAGAKKLKDAYPYSSLSTSASSAGFGFGNSQATGPSSAMRDGYVRTRMRQPVREFSKLLLSYMSYFTSANAGPSNPSTSQRPPAVSLHPSETFTFLHAVTLHLFRLPYLTLAEFCRPSENVVFPRLQAEWTAWVQRVDDDVNKWAGMYRDEVVKSWERGLDELVAGEEQCLQQALVAQTQAQGEGTSVDVRGYIGMRRIRDRWVEQAGWLIGRRPEGMEM
ncbi:hypothetical protein FRB99_000936 [Tulasnella sp. 403]|nr:hypothetical protein FRB99_000936 [Tulasnella sp. 403]